MRTETENCCLLRGPRVRGPWQYRMSIGLGWALLVLVSGCSRDSADDFKPFQPTTVELESGQNADSSDGMNNRGQTGGDQLANADGTNQSTDAQSTANSATDGDDAAIGRRMAPPAARARQIHTPAVAESAKRPPREIKLLIPEKEFQVVGPEEALRVGYDDLDLLKVLNMEPVPVDCVSHFPDWLKALDGKRIRIRGFMYPPFQETGIPFFVLARDNDICCMGRDPKRYDVIDVSMRDGVTTHYIANRPFDVVGVFRIQPEAARGQLYQLYVIDDAVVIEL